MKVVNAPPPVPNRHPAATTTADPRPADGLAGVVAAMLQTPQFLYRPEPVVAGTGTPQPVDGYALATRLSYLLTGAGPDQALLAAAEAGDLATEAGLLSQTDRLLADPRAAELFVHFASEWWEIEPLATMERTSPCTRPGPTARRLRSPRSPRAFWPTPGRTDRR